MERHEVASIVEELVGDYFKERHCPVCKGETLFVKIPFMPDSEEEEYRQEVKCLRCNTLFGVKLEKVAIKPDKE